MTSLVTLVGALQRQLFPVLEKELGPLTALEVEFSAVLAVADLGRFARRYAWCGNGAPPRARVWLLHAFLAKSVYQFPTTAELREALRAFIGYGRKLSDTTRVEIGFLEQTLQKRGGKIWENNHTVGIWLTTRFPFGN